VTRVVAVALVAASLVGVARAAIVPDRATVVAVDRAGNRSLPES